MSSGSTELYHHLEKLRAAYLTLRNAAWRHFDHHRSLPVEFGTVTQYLDLLLQTMDQGVLFIDQEGKILTYNQQAESLLKIPAEQVIHKTFWNLFADDLFGFSVKAALKEQQPIENQLLQNGSLALNIDFHPVISPPAQGGVLLIQDISAERQWQLLANRRDRLQELGEVAGLVAHEIRNPLAGIQGYANLLQRDLAHEPEKQKLANAIAEGTADLNQLVGAILNFAHPLEPQFETVDIAQLLAELKQEIQVQPNVDPGIEFQFTCPEGLMGKIDPHLMKAALRNLLFNAIQAMPSGGTVALNAFENGFEVRDDGIGIAPENMDKIFSPFFTTREQGNGFGLAEVKKIVQSHQGEIDCNSTIGLGTTFRIRLWTRS